MAWADEIVPMVRALINDTSESTPTYSDSVLEDAVVIAAQLMTQFEVDFDICYTMSIASVSITPDPTGFGGTNPRDNSFINLAALKTAMIILQGQIQGIALQAVRITDGPSSIDYTEAARMVRKNFDEIKAQYEHARMQYQAGNRVGLAVISKGREYRPWWTPWVGGPY